MKEEAEAQERSQIKRLVLEASAPPTRPPSLHFFLTPPLPQTPPLSPPHPPSSTHWVPDGPGGDRCAGKQEGGGGDEGGRAGGEVAAGEAERCGGEGTGASGQGGRLAGGACGRSQRPSWGCPDLIEPGAAPPPAVLSPLSFGGQGALADGPLQALRPIAWAVPAAPPRRINAGRELYRADGAPRGQESCPPCKKAKALLAWCEAAGCKALQRRSRDAARGTCRSLQWHGKAPSSRVSRRGRDGWQDRLFPPVWRRTASERFHGLPPLPPPLAFLQGLSVARPLLQRPRCAGEEEPVALAAHRP